MANYYASLSVLFPVGTAENIAPALALYGQFADELEAGDETIGFEAQADEPPTGSHLWLHAGENAEPEHVITFALRCAVELGLTGLWGFRWSLSCSRPMLDGFGGGAQLLDLGQRKSLAWVDTEEWVRERLAASEDAPVSAEAIFDPVVVNQSWTEATQACELLAFVNREIAADPTVAGRFRAFLAEVSAGPDEMCCRECGEAMFIADAGTSHHLGSGMDDIDHDRDRDHVAIPETEG